MVCYDDPQSCPKKYLFDASFRKNLANALNSAIVAVINKEMLTSPEAFLQKARRLRKCALQVRLFLYVILRRPFQVNTAGAIYADEQRIFREDFSQPPTSQPTSRSSSEESQTEQVNPNV